jgi:MFS family permease
MHSVPKLLRSPFIPFGVRVLLISHAVFWLSANLFLPFLSIFFIDELQGVTITEVGIGTLIFFLSFGLLEPVIGLISDKIPGLKDELILLIFGYVARGLLFISFAFATNVWHLYMFQFLMGVFRALAGPADKVLYAKYLHGRESATLWGIDESLTNLSSALGAGVGGYMIAVLGFRSMLVVTGFGTILAGVINVALISTFQTQKTKKKWLKF